MRIYGSKKRIILYVLILIFIDIRIYTCYNVTTIRKGDTKDAIDAQRNAQTSKEKWI